MITKQFTVLSSGVVFGGGCVTEGYIDNSGTIDSDGDGVLDIDESAVTDADKDAIKDALMPPGIVAKSMRVPFLMLIIFICMIATASALFYYQVHDARVWMTGIGGVFVIGYLFGIWLKVFDAWPILVLIVVGGAFIALRFTPLSQYVGGGR